jgi:hypothetical protein
VLRIYRCAQLCSCVREPRSLFATFVLLLVAVVVVVQELIAAKTVTISNLLAVAPAGTVDPSPMMYDALQCVRSARCVDSSSRGVASAATTRPCTRWADFCPSRLCATR